MKVASLFSGCGGFDLGFLQAGHEVCFACDIDFKACLTYKMNLDSPIVNMDIGVVNRVPDCDLIIGGPPCQGFSFANTKKKNDERNDLIFEFARIIQINQPKYFIMENVLGIYQYPNLLIDFCNRLHDYDITSYKINAVDYGVPQKRIRCFLWVGIHIARAIRSLN